MYEQASLPTVRPSQQDQRAYRLTLTSRALRVLKLANVNMDPVIATQGKLLGEITWVLASLKVTCICIHERLCPRTIFQFASLPAADPTFAHAAEAALYKANGQPSISAKIPITKDPQCVRAFRDEIALCCIKEAQRLYPQAIAFHFNTPVQMVEINKQIVHISTVGPSKTEVCSSFSSLLHLAACCVVYTFVGSTPDQAG